ncbi:MAG TPA: hypothetical protein VHF06_25425 [Pseudonocardiaceae bacterium]|jgi:hypothetical protein|nr:hypothetical protein [Pseudonocardiaceae bacterium]
MLRRREVQLVCGECHAVFATVCLRPLALGMDVHSTVTGSVLMPRTGYSVTQETRYRLARAEAAGAHDLASSLELNSARAMADYLNRYLGETVYEMHCHCRRRYVRTTPDLQRGALATKGRRLTLSSRTATWPPAG